MFGLIVKLTSASGRRSDLIEMLGGEDSHTVDGCLSFIVAEDIAEENVLWITEVWTSQEAHEASLKIQVPRMDGIEAAIVRFDKVATTQPVKKSSHPLNGEALRSERQRST
jgi:quinol monooxygenase YgiN